MRLPTRQFGTNGPDLTILGFGAMRLPGFRDGKYDECMDMAVDLIRKGIESGINYIDTANLYDAGNSEIAVGKAIRGCRDKVIISTKIIVTAVPSTDDFKRMFDVCCRRLDTEKVDIFYFHGLYWKNFEREVKNLKLLEEVEKLQNQGRIGLLGFSSHDRPDNISKLIDTQLFAGMLVQYNIVDDTNQEVISKAYHRGMGVALMGPVGGGRLAGIGPDFTKIIPDGFGDAPELALKYVWSNPAVTTALSGMESEEVLKANIKTALDFSPLTDEQIEKVNELKEKLEGLNEIYCSGCGYCLPCEQKVNIPGIFNLLICHEIYGAKNYARDMYKLIGLFPIIPGKNASYCTECGKCEEKCPQNVSIIEQLKRTHELLSK